MFERIKEKKNAIFAILAFGNNNICNLKTLPESEPFSIPKNRTSYRDNY